MQKVLLTGGSGFIGRNIKDYLAKRCDLFAPTRAELNLLDERSVRNYISDNKVNVVIHSANPNPVKNQLDHAESMFEDSIRVFTNLLQAQDLYDRMYTLGSGAEYDKSRDIKLIGEDEAGRSVPYDSYGLIKYTINKVIETSEKQYNLRIFACYGPTDHPSKFITHCIACCLKGEDITIRKDCYFDYMHVSDLAKILPYFIDNKPMHKVYNVCTGQRVRLSEIAAIVKRLMQVDCDIRILSDEEGFEYTGSNERLMDELHGFEFLSLEKGIRMQIESEKNAI